MANTLEKGEGHQLGILDCVASHFAGSKSFGKDQLSHKRLLVHLWVNGGEGPLGTQLWTSSAKYGALGGGGDNHNAWHLCQPDCRFNNFIFPNAERGKFRSTDAPPCMITMEPKFFS